MHHAFFCKMAAISSKLSSRCQPRLKGPSGAARELKTCRAQPQTWRVQKRSEAGRRDCRHREGTNCTRARTAKKTHGQAWTWTKTTTSKKRRRRRQQSWRRPRRTNIARCRAAPRRESLPRDEIEHVTWVHRTSAPAGETSNRRRDIDISSGGSALENEQIDKAVAAMDIAQELKEGENVICATRAGASGKPRAPCGELKDDRKILWYLFDKEYVFRQREGNGSWRGWERVAHPGRFLESAG